MKAYPKYKASDVLWCRKVPQHWELHRAKFLFRKMNRPVRDGDDVVTCFRDGIVTLRKNRRTKGFTESLKEIGYQGIRIGDLVIHQMDAFAGAAGVSDSDGKGTSVYSVCYPKRELDPEYFAHLVREMARNEYILSLAKGIRERSTDFRFNTFGAQILPFPPLIEQQQTSRYLDWQTSKINKFIKAKKKLIALLKEQKQNIINEAVTKGINPDVAMKDSGIEWLGDIPAHWEVRRLKQIVQFNPSKNENLKTASPEERVVFLPMEKISVDGKIDCSLKSELKQVSAGFTYFAKNDVVIAKITPCFENGKGAFLSELETAFAFGTTELFVLRPSNKIYGMFLRYLSSSKRFLELGAQHMFGATGQQRVQSSFLKNYELGLPPIKEQLMIVDFLIKETVLIDKTIARTEREIELIQEYRTRLVSDVVTGKVDVQSIEIPDFEPVEADLDVQEDEVSEEVLMTEKESINE